MIASRSLTKHELVIREFGNWPLFQELLSALESIGRRHGTSISTVAIHYILDRPGVAAAIVGARNAEDLDATLQAFSLERFADLAGDLQSFVGYCHVNEGPGKVRR